MKKSTMRRLLVLTLCLTMVSMSLIGGTLAKYTSSASANSVGTVAKWSFKVGESDITNLQDSTTFEFDLFESIVKESGIKDENNVNLIGPGTEGSFQLQLTNASEVLADYKIEFTYAEKNVGAEASQADAYKIPLEFSLSNDADAIWYSAANIESLNIDSAAMVKADKTDTYTTLSWETGNDSVTVTVYWRWKFDNSDDANYNTNDTALGVLAQNKNRPSATVTAKITATQNDGAATSSTPTE